jgi:hypothetical protein
MDVKGAQALAERILQQEQAGPRPPAEGRQALPRRVPTGTEVVWLPARSVADRPDLRIYTAEVRLEEVNGRSTAVTVVHCLRVVDGRWQSRVVEVDVGRPRSSL